ncbi:MAG: polysaccharide biosynthesis protein [Lachnospiraceae bacterium]|jgi:stage V sporulation protein B|nr:polysaccharide biosynthesis protein [Lachnospiraceae bacterium]
MEKRKSGKKISFVAQGGMEHYTLLICYLIGALRMFFFLNKVSGEGISHYAFAFEGYTILYILCSLAISKVLARMVNARQTRKQYRNRIRLFRYVLLRVSILSIFFGIIVFFLADRIGRALLGNANSALTLQCLGLALIPTALFAVLGYYFNGMGFKIPYCIAQIIEQLVNLAVTLLAANLLFGYGNKVSALLVDDTRKNAFGAAAGAIGVFAGSVFGILFLLLIMTLLRQIFAGDRREDATRAKESFGEIARNAEYLGLKTMLPLLFTSLAVFLNQLLYFKFSKGDPAVLASEYGIYYAQVRIWVFFPILFAAMLENTLSGQLKRVLKKEDYQYANDRIGKSLKELMNLLIPSAVFVFVCAKPLIRLFYKGNTDLAVSLLKVSAVLIILNGISSVFTAVLRSLEKDWILAGMQAAACIVEVLSFGLIFIGSDRPVMGLVYAMLTAAVVRLFGLGMIVMVKLKYSPEIVFTFGLPFILSAVIGGIDFLICLFLADVLGSIFTLLICGLISSVLYMGAVITTRTLSTNELLEMPLGQYWCKIARYVGLID